MFLLQFGRVFVYNLARYPTGPESEKSPSEPFENPVLESEVFFKASFLAQNEAEEQKNQVSRVACFYSFIPLHICLLKLLP